MPLIGYISTIVVAHENKSDSTISTMTIIIYHNLSHFNLFHLIFSVTMVIFLWLFLGSDDPEHVQEACVSELEWRNSLATRAWHMGQVYWSSQLHFQDQGGLRGEHHQWSSGGWHRVDKVGSFKWSARHGWVTLCWSFSWTTIIIPNKNMCQILATKFFPNWRKCAALRLRYADMYISLQMYTAAPYTTLAWCFLHQRVVCIMYNVRFHVAYVQIHVA